MQEFLRGSQTEHGPRLSLMVIWCETGMALRGLEVSYEAVRDWETKLLPVIGDALRKRRLIFLGFCGHPEA